MEDTANNINCPQVRKCAHKHRAIGSVLHGLKQLTPFVCSNAHKRTASISMWVAGGLKIKFPMLTRRRLAKVLFINEKQRIVCGK